MMTYATSKFSLEKYFPSPAIFIAERVCAVKSPNILYAIFNTGQKNSVNFTNNLAQRAKSAKIAMYMVRLNICPYDQVGGEQKPFDPS